MKKTTLYLVACLFSLNVMGQGHADAFIKEAQDYLAKKDYKQAQLSLQDAINDINMMLAADLAKTLPAEINGLKAEGEAEVNTASMGIMGGGFTITKRYKSDTKKEISAEVQLLANSPMLGTLNMYLTNPSMMGSEYKSVRVGGTQRAILKSEMQDYYDDNGASKKIRSSELQIPLSQTLITIHLNGFASEQEELDFAAKLDLAKLKAALGE